MKTAAWTALGFAWAAAASGDMGSIPYKPGVQVFEPNQRALIAWNGREELLVLSTDLRASEPTKVLEVIPLPARPEVRKGDVRVFVEATRLINAKLARRRRPGRGSTLAGGGAGGPPERPEPAGEITLHKQIGPTDVSVAHVLDADRFVEWVVEHLKSRKATAVDVPEPMQKVVREYLRDGCAWFSFNVVSLGEKTATRQAIEYRFRCECVYYPLRITRTESGQTSIRLLVLTPGTLRRETFTALPGSRVAALHQPVTCTARELAHLHTGAFSLLGRPVAAQLHTWEITGELSAFQDDLLAGRPRRFWLRDGAGRRSFGPYPLLDRARIRVGRERFRILLDDPENLGPTPGFRLKDIKFNNPYGPFKLEDGAGIMLGGKVFTLRTRPPTPGASDAKALEPDAEAQSPSPAGRARYRASTFRQ